MTKEWEAKVGDVVRLKSGGANMTVYSFGGPDEQIRINCIWIEDSGKLHTVPFDMSHLVGPWLAGFNP